MAYPQWLIPAYIRSARAAGSSSSDEALTRAVLRLLERWSAPGRHHHGVQHLGDMLARITTLAPETHNPELVSLAAFYHGCVFSTAEEDTYTRNGGEDEHESARVASSELTAIGISPDTVSRVADLITGMKKQPKEADPSISTTLSAIDIDKLALRDAHLGALAAGPQKYTKYLDQVAKEYSHIPEEDFLRARREIIGKLLARRQIFLSPLGRQWEAPARDNLEGELERIESRLAAITDLHPSVASEPPADWDVPALGTPAGDGPLSPEEYSRIRAAAPQSPVSRIPTADIAPSVAEEAIGAPQRQTPRRGISRDTDLQSSLETVPDSPGPGTAPREAQEAKKQVDREDIARKMQERAARRQAGPPVTQPSPAVSAATPPSPPSPAGPASATTPEWIGEDGSARAGFEREPDY